MSDVSHALQRAITERLKASPPVAAMIGARVFDKVKRGADFPYVSFGPSQVVNDAADDFAGSTVIMQLDAWTREEGFMQARALHGVVREALDCADLALAGYRLTLLSYESASFLRDPDGLTSHAAMSFRALVEPAG